MGQKAKEIDKAVDRLIKGNYDESSVRSGKVVGYCACGAILSGLDLVGGKKEVYYCYSCREEVKGSELLSERPVDIGRGSLEIDDSKDRGISYDIDFGLKVDTVDIEDEFEN